MRSYLLGVILGLGVLQVLKSNGPCSADIFSGHFGSASADGGGCGCGGAGGAGSGGAGGAGGSGDINSAYAAKCECSQQNGTAAEIDRSLFKPFAYSPMSRRQFSLSAAAAPSSQGQAFPVMGINAGFPIY